MVDEKLLHFIGGKVCIDAEYFQIEGWMKGLKQLICSLVKYLSEGKDGKIVKSCRPSGFGSKKKEINDRLLQVMQ